MLTASTIAIHGTSGTVSTAAGQAGEVMTIVELAGDAETPREWSFRLLDGGERLMINYVGLDAPFVFQRCPAAAAKAQ